MSSLRLSNSHLDYCSVGNSGAALIGSLQCQNLRSLKLGTLPISSDGNGITYVGMKQILSVNFRNLSVLSLS